MRRLKGSGTVQVKFSGRVIRVLRAKFGVKSSVRACVGEAFAGALCGGGIGSVEKAFIGGGADDSEWKRLALIGAMECRAKRSHNGFIQVFGQTRRDAQVNRATRSLPRDRV